MILITLVGSNKLKGHGRKIVSICKYSAGKPDGKMHDLEVNSGVIQLVMYWRHIDVDLEKDVT